MCPLVSVSVAAAKTAAHSRLERVRLFERIYSFDISTIFERLGFVRGEPHR